LPRRRTGQRPAASQPSAFPGAHSLLLFVRLATPYHAGHLKLARDMPGFGGESRGGVDPSLLCSGSNLGVRSNAGSRPQNLGRLPRTVTRQTRGVRAELTTLIPREA